MKYSEFIREVKKAGWVVIRQRGSHKIFEKDGRIYPVPDHGAREIPKGLELKMRKDMGL